MQWITKIYLSLALIIFLSSSSIYAVRTETLKVALLTPGPIDDAGWSESGYTGLKLIEKELNAEISYQEKVTEQEEVLEHMRRFAKENHHFIIGLGGRYVKPAEIVAKEFPRVKFAVVTDYAGNNRNLGALSFRTNQGAFVMGALAAVKTKSNRITIIYGKDHPQQKKAAEAYQLGAKWVKPDIEVNIRYVGSWYDIEKAIQVAQEEIDSGSDVLHVSTDQGDKAIFKLVEKAQIHATGATIDNNQFAPNNILSSVIQDVPLLLLEGAKVVRIGRWEGKQYKFGLNKNTVRFAPYYGLLTEQEEQQIAEIIKKIKVGEIDVSP